MLFQPLAGSSNASDVSNVSVCADLTPTRSTLLCRCSGNCGSPLCKQRSNKRRYDAAIEVCTRPKVPEGSFGARCTCEAYACLACRSKRSITQGICQKRWCAECCIDKQGITKQQYVNAFGVHRLNRSWSSELRVTARLCLLWPWTLPK